MRPDFKISIYNSHGDINQNHFLNLVFGRIRKLNWLLKIVFLRGLSLVLVFCYTLNLYFFF